MEWVLLGHIAFAAVWFGGHVYIEGLLASAGRSGDNTTLAVTAAQVGKVSFRVFPIAIILTLVFGVWLLLDGQADHEFSDLFVSVGFLAVIIGMGTGIFYIAPKDKQITELLDARGPDDPQLHDLIGKVTMVNHLMTLVVAVALVFMVIKPGL